MKYDIIEANGTEKIEAANWDGVTECVKGQLIMDCGAAGTRVYDSIEDLRNDFPDAEYGDETSKIDLDNVSDANLYDVWQACDSEIFRVLDEEGVNVGAAQVRKLAGGTFIYTDDQDGFSLMAQDRVERLILVADADHVALGYSANGDVIKL